MQDRFDIIVVGGGMMGSAAARHLASAGRSVAVVAPSEPAQRHAHTGPFASHYDQARITRKLATDPDWGLLSVRSIARYAALEADTGIRFHHATGALMAASPRHEDEGAAARVAATDEALGIGATRMKGAGITEHLPFLAFSDDTHAFYETTGGGHINPRAHVRAQLAAARARGAVLLDRVATHIAQTASAAQVTLDGGEVLSGETCVVACGGYTGMSGLLPDPVPLSVYARTVAFFEVDAAEAARLREMPTMIIYPPGVNHDFYVLPPVRYPDGKLYIKIGGEPVDRELFTPAQVGDWFRTDGARDLTTYFSDHLHGFLPGLCSLSCHTDACVTSLSPSGKPLIYKPSDRVVVLTAGNGAGAKNADELGRLGALLAMGETLAEEGYATNFQP